MLTPMKFPGAGLLALVVLIASVPAARAADYALPTVTSGDRMLAGTFRAETGKLSARCLADVRSLSDWTERRGEHRRELFDMLGLHPLPDRGELHAVVTSKMERGDFVVENLHFQSSPGLYVTANLYLPKPLSGPAPTILYLSGHGPVISNGVSYGNKVSYQHHGAWFARNGYICLVVDTLQLGEILGLHHGTYREGMWWWNSRGYTPAGVEAWNCIRALDYLSTRPEVDTNRFGATGRSGGGAYSWWIAALDDRIKAAAPVAGITDLHNHVIDGTVEGHCDCMFMVNSHRWDYPEVAALVAPRPLLIVNTDADTIFPLDGVVRLHSQVRRIYALSGAAANLGLVIGPGPHKDTQDLQVPVFRWFNVHLKGEDPVIEMAATKLLSPEELRVFKTLPADAVNTNIHSLFVPKAAAASPPRSREEWSAQAAHWKHELKERCLAGWPAVPGPLLVDRRFARTASGLTLEAFDFDSEPTLRLRIYVLKEEAGTRGRRASVQILDGAQWRRQFTALSGVFGDVLSEETMVLGESRPAENPGHAGMLRADLSRAGRPLVFFAPRGIGLNAWSADARREVQIQRRFMLLGQTLNAMRAWDIARACQATRLIPALQSAELSLTASGSMAVNAMFAALFGEGEPVTGLKLDSPPTTFEHGPDYLNVLRVLDVPQLMALAVERCAVEVDSLEPNDWGYVEKTVPAMGGSGRFTVRQLQRTAAR